MQSNPARARQKVLNLIETERTVSRYEGVWLISDIQHPLASGYEKTVGVSDAFDSAKILNVCGNVMMSFQIHGIGIYRRLGMSLEHVLRITNFTPSLISFPFLLF